MRTKVSEPTNGSFMIFAITNPANIDKVDAAIGDNLAANFFWAPVSVLHKADGSVERFPHLVTDRAKPGVIAVNRAGQRFVNESDSYHCFVEAMFAE